MHGVPQPVDPTLVVIVTDGSHGLIALGDDDNDNGEPNLYRPDDPEIRALLAEFGPGARAVSLAEFRTLVGEEALNDFPLLARYRGTPGYEQLLCLAETLLDGGMLGEIELDLEETPWDELDAWAENGCEEYGGLLGIDPGTWREDTRGGAAWVTFDDDGNDEDD
jgi:hypothetical protein